MDSRVSLGARRVAIAASLALAGSVLVGGVAAAKSAPHPAHVHVGACPAPGDVVAPLSDVSFDMNVDGQPTAGSAVGSAAAIPVEASRTTVKLAMSDIVGSPHSVVVHKSAEEMGTYIACGDVGGVTMAQTDLPIGLAELNDSGASGVARLHDNGDGTTTVEIFLVEPVAAASAVTISGFKFDPADLSVPAGTAVTWTNMDGPTHTVTADDGSFDSGNLANGATFSFTFATAGTFAYHCKIHSSMKGTITVS